MIDHHSGKKLDDGPQFLKFGNVVVVDRTSGKSMCDDSVSGQPPLGCFAVLDVR
jgi:elongation factor 1-alpha